MKKITPVILGLSSFFCGLIFLVLPALADNWVETTVLESEPTFFDADSAYVDVATGLVVVEFAGKFAGGDDFWYVLYAYDCSRWVRYMIGDLQSEGWWYDLYGELEERSIYAPDTPGGQTAQWACDNYDSHPSGNIPFDFKFSNY